MDKKGWSQDPVAKVYMHDDDGSKAVVVFHGSVGVSLDGETQVNNFALLLEMGGQGEGWDVKDMGIASDFMDVAELGIKEVPA